MAGLSRLGTVIVTIYVGEDKVKFTIHKKLLCDHVKFFDKAFRGGFKEVADGVVHLPDQDPDAFGLFVEWIYQTHFPSFRSVDDPRIFCRLYMFAEKTAQEDLANATADILGNSGVIRTERPVFDIIKEVYEKTIDGSPLRKLCASSLADLVYNNVREVSGAHGLTGANAAFIVTQQLLTVQAMLIKQTRIKRTRKNMKSKEGQHCEDD
ncbi:BTB POZ domain-containing protein [Rutstroemia sp. NJR-2017a WRK4]|nr:BTB POZ domain-containing protein [Rutstroemia sp. NJR-2017a WRK4]